MLVRQAGEIELIPEVLDKEEDEDGEFAFALEFRSDFVDEAVHRGLFPMSVPYRNFMLFAFKLHHQRCVLDLKDVSASRSWAVPGKSELRRARHWRVSSNECFEEVTRGIVAKHGYNWLCPPLLQVFREMYDRKSAEKPRVVTFEVRQHESGELVAGELGICVGTVYTSLTGFFESHASGAGTFQLKAMLRFLRARGFSIVDFGMEMPYKLALGATLWPRAYWLQSYPSLRDLPAPSPWPQNTTIDPKSGLILDI